MGDFGKYVLDRGALYRLTAAPISRPFPSRQPPPVRGPSLARLLTSDQGDAGVALLEELMRTASAVRRRPRPTGPRQFSSERVARWIFGRVRQLGWTPERFADFDRARVYNDVRGTRKEERIGKKYQWIALHEAIGRVADHVWMREGWSEESSAVVCPGAWALGLRDLDPTLLAARKPPFEMAQVWWQPYPKQFDPLSRAAQQRWLENTQLPRLDRLIRPLDAAARRWFAVEAHYMWGEPEPIAPIGSRPCTRVLWIQIQGYLVGQRRVEEARRYLRALRERDQPPQSLELRSVFLGELGWHPAYGSAMGMWQRDGAFDIPFDRPGERYMPTSEFDCSLPEDVSGYVPGPMLRSELSLAMGRQSFAFGAPEPVAIDPSWQEDGPSVLLIRADALETALRRRSRTLVWIVRGEKYHAYGDESTPTDRQMFDGTFWLDGDGIRGRLTRRIERGGRRSCGTDV